MSDKHANRCPLFCGAAKVCATCPFSKEWEDCTNRGEIVGGEPLVWVEDKLLPMDRQGNQMVLYEHLDFALLMPRIAELTGDTLLRNQDSAKMNHFVEKHIKHIDFQEICRDTKNPTESEDHTLPFGAAKPDFRELKLDKTRPTAAPVGRGAVCRKTNPIHQATAGFRSRKRKTARKSG